MYSELKSDETKSFFDRRRTWTIVVLAAVLVAASIVGVMSTQKSVVDNANTGAAPAKGLVMESMPQSGESSRISPKSDIVCEDFPCGHCPPAFNCVKECGPNGHCLSQNLPVQCDQLTCGDGKCQENGCVCYKGNCFSNYADALRLTSSNLASPFIACEDFPCGHCPQGFNCQKKCGPFGHCLSPSNSPPRPGSSLIVCEDFECQYGCPSNLNCLKQCGPDGNCVSRNALATPCYKFSASCYKPNNECDKRSDCECFKGTSCASKNQARRLVGTWRDATGSCFFMRDNGRGGVVINPGANSLLLGAVTVRGGTGYAEFVYTKNGGFAYKVGINAIREDDTVIEWENGVMWTQFSKSLEGCPGAI